ncbi:MAG: HAMP domain-containing sensor histidine kinase [Actinomycetota bacterium]
MEVLLIVGLAVAVASLAALMRTRRRAVAAEASLRRAANVVGSEESGEAVVQALRIVSAEAESDRQRAVALEAVIKGASIGVVWLNQSGEPECSNDIADVLLGGEGEQSMLRVRVATLAQRVSRSGRAEEMEVDLYDPSRQVLRLRAVPVLSSDSRHHSVAIYLEDLSLERRVHAMRSDFVANASHELKTPLGALSLLAETLAGTDDEIQRARLASRLSDEAVRMSNVIDDVVQLAETQSLGEEFAPVGIAGLLKEATDAVRTVADDRGISLIAGEVNDVAVQGSRDQLISAVRNLLDNAIAYSSIGDVKGAVTYSAIAEESEVRIEIRDTGIGIPERYQDRVFERFFRVDRARSRESGGTGLGLSIVKNVALAHGGTVGLESELGVGSTFHMLLPIAQED